MTRTAKNKAKIRHVRHYSPLQPTELHTLERARTCTHTETKWFVKAPPPFVGRTDTSGGLRFNRMPTFSSSCVGFVEKWAVCCISLWNINVSSIFYWKVLGESKGEREKERDESFVSISFWASSFVGSKTSTDMKSHWVEQTALPVVTKCSRWPWGWYHKTSQLPGVGGWAGWSQEVLKWLWHLVSDTLQININKHCVQSCCIPSFICVTN